VSDLLAIAFDRAAGLETETTAVPEARQRFARRVVEAGRRMAASPACPPALLRRALALADAPRAGVAAVLRLVFDSWAVAGATRGGAGERLLRFEGDGSALDVEIAEEPGGGARLAGSVEGVPASASLAIERRRGASTRVALRAGGTFEARVEAAVAGASLVVRDGRKVLLRAPIPPSRGARDG
jgi:hypothetical protein